MTEMGRLIAGLLLLTLAGGAQAAQKLPKVGPIGPTPPSLVVEPVAMMIATFDQDQDGKVTRDELQKGVRHSFEAIDTAHSGKLGYIAFADWAQKWLGDATALPGPFETDADGDNQITLDEMQAKFAQIFARLDKNHDGVLTRAELLTNDGGDGFLPDDHLRFRWHLVRQWALVPIDRR
jgi:Ca2+-binding EF-hand superfamily protein